MNLFNITERAAKRARELLAKNNMADGAIRVRVLAGGCSGLEYSMDPTSDGPQEGDMTVEAFGLKVYIDAKSILFLAGTNLDYQETLMNQRFVFNNPKASTTCSCGESFNV